MSLNAAAGCYSQKVETESAAKSATRKRCITEVHRAARVDWSAAMVAEVEGYLVL